ncbi:haloacid dehalogenase [Erysipelotrichaceae bacterium]|nr:haloacid dehalogenase [Erysipelotrichaceae bacterium]
MKHRGIIFTDLDGTLLFETKDSLGIRKTSIRDEDLEALHMLRESGYLIVIATGRDVKGIRRFLQQAYIAFDYYIGNNGALILNQFFQTLKCEAMDGSLLGEVITDVRANFPTANFSGTNEKNLYYFEQKQRPEIIEEHELVIPYTKYLADPFKLTLLAISEDDTLDKEVQITAAIAIAERISNQFESRVNVFRNQTTVDLAAVGVSKGSAVEYIAKLEDISLDAVYVIGDSWNDVSMFEIGATSYSFTHAEDQIQEKASHIVESFAEMVQKLGIL